MTAAESRAIERLEKAKAKVTEEHSRTGEVAGAKGDISLQDVAHEMDQDAEDNIEDIVREWYGDNIDNPG